MPGLIARQLLADGESLGDYLRGREPDVDLVRRRLFLLERSVNHRLPDHYYHNRREKLLGGVKGIGELLCRSLAALTETNLTFRGNRVVVKEGRFGRWQQLLTRVPPLCLVSYALFREFAPPPLEPERIAEYVREIVRPNLGNTTLPSPHYPQLERFILENGLSDLHLHLNGTTELDHVWLKVLEQPHDFHAEFRNALKDEIVKEQFDQIEPGLTPGMMFHRFRLAGRLRQLLADRLYLGCPMEYKTFRKVTRLDTMPFSGDSDLTPRARHPLKELFPALGDENSSTLEGLFYTHAFGHLRRDDDPVFARGLHLYLLLSGFFNKFLVQQVEQKGFDQFQKIANNEGRSSVEKVYYRRFSQISGAGGGDLSFVEGRFAPKATPRKNLELLNRILSGFAEFQGDAPFTLFTSRDIRCGNRMKLRLTAHFIKHRADLSDMGIKVRHENLRKDLERTGRALLDARRHSSPVRRYLTGIDAAANELHAPPEVFAPLYRRFRREGFVNFTYHVGEDYAHLVSGIRSVYEAAKFLDLRPGNRIGHGTAVGIDPALWRKHVGDSLVIGLGEWLDNLVFAYSILGREPEAFNLLGVLRDKIERLAWEMYEAPLQVSTLVDAWKFRRLDPLVACNPERPPTEKLHMREWEEWRLVEEARKRSGRALELFRDYHRARSAARGEKKIEVSRDLLFTEETLRLLQRSVLKTLHRREIVIESMPTSNVRISFYEDYREHHIWRWLKVDKAAGNGGEHGDGEADRDEAVPPVCLASDDPGIFATNSRNEYSHIFEVLTRDFNRSHDEAMAVVRSLADNGTTYGFD